MGKKSKRHARHIPKVTTIVNSFTLNKNKHLLDKVIKECQTSVYYHKFLISKTASYDKDYIIKSILDFVYPYTIIPINFKQYKKTCRFVAKNCTEAMMKILNQQCKIPHPLDPNTPFSLTVMANCALPEEIEVSEIDNSDKITKVVENQLNKDANMLNTFSGVIGSNYTKNIQNVMEKGLNNDAEMLDANHFSGDIGSNYNKKSKTLDVNHFSNAMDSNYCKNIQEFMENRFNKKNKMLNLNNFSADIDLNAYIPNQQHFYYIINQAVKLGPHEIHLQNNCITNISSINLLKMFVKILDLSNNKIEDINMLSALIGFTNLIDLNLTGNPLCAKYDSYNYVIDVKRYCPKLEKLDGIDITTPQFRKNFMCTAEADELAAQFVKYYFSVYDSTNRVDLNKMYDPLAIFSVNAKVIPNQKNSKTVNLNHYGLKNPYSVCGMVDIMKLFQEFPKTYHDPYPIVCDVTIYNDARTHLVISGIFKEFDQMLSFNRSFYFKRFGQEFVITNEQLHISNASDYQRGWSFIFPSDVRLAGTPLPYFYEQYKQLEEALHKITNMNLEHCQKYLVYCNYDLKKALILFSELHINKGIPYEAFLTKRKTIKNIEETTICETLQKKVVAKHGSISLKTLWDTVNNERLESSNDTPVVMNPTIKKIFKKPFASSAYISHSHTPINIVGSTSSTKPFNRIKNNDQSNLMLVQKNIGNYEYHKKNQQLDSHKKNKYNISNKRQSETNLRKTFISKWSKDGIQDTSDKIDPNKRSVETSSVNNTLSLLKINATVQDILQEYHDQRDQYKKPDGKKTAELSRTKNTNTNTLVSSNVKKNSQVNLNTIAQNTHAPVQVPCPNRNDLELKKKQLATKIFSTAVSKSIPKKNESTNKHEPKITSQSGTTKERISKNDTSEIQENLKKQKQKLIQLRKQLDSTIKLKTPTSSRRTDDTSQQKLIINMRQQLQVEKRRLLVLKSELISKSIKTRKEQSSSVNSTTQKQIESGNKTQDQDIVTIEDSSPENKIHDSNQSSNLENESHNKPLRRRTGRYRRMLKVKKKRALLHYNINTSTVNIINTEPSSVNIIRMKTSSTNLTSTTTTNVSLVQFPATKESDTILKGELIKNVKVESPRNIADNKPSTTADLKKIEMKPIKKEFPLFIQNK